MALSSLLLGAPKKLVLWIEVGGSMIAIDTLVHNFLHRTGILLGSTRTTSMVRPATGRAAARTSFKQSPSGSMLGSSIQRFRRPFPGSSSTRSGHTAARAASPFATAIALTTLNAAATSIPDADRRTRERTLNRRPDVGYPSFRRDPFARDVLLDPGGTAMPRITALHMLRSTIRTVSAPANSSFRGSITHPTQPLCTLRNHCRQWPRNTRYQADARPYLGRTCTG